MPTITVLCTHHSELGKCNSYELLNIMDSLSPEVIFEELPTSLFDIMYGSFGGTGLPLEIKAVKMYLEKNQVKHIPVDREICDSLSNEEIEAMFNSFKKHAAYEAIEAEQIELTRKYGFNFLNSDYFSDLFEKKTGLEKNLTEFFFNMKCYNKVLNLFYEEQERREHEMLDNIYDYTRKNYFEKGILLVGAGHRKPIINKLGFKKPDNSIKWSFYESPFSS